MVDQQHQRLLKHVSYLEIGTVATSLTQHDVAVTQDMLVMCCDITSLENIDTVIQTSNHALQALDDGNENQQLAEKLSWGQRGCQRYEIHQQQLETS